MRKKPLLKLTIFIFFFLVILTCQKSSIVQAETEKNELPQIYFSSEYPRKTLPTTGTQKVTLFNDIGHYSIQTIGGSNTYGFDHPSKKTEYKKEDLTDLDPLHINSTGMDYIPNGKVKKAYLFFFESTESGIKPDRKNTYIEGPKGNKFKIDTGKEETFYDVTEFIKNEGAGNYWGKNIESDRRDMANADNLATWGIVFIEENADFPIRTTLVEGLKIYTQGVVTLGDKNSIPIKEFNKASGSFTGLVGGGNAMGGDILQVQAYKNNQLIKATNLSDDIRPASNYFNGSITKNGQDIKTRKPNAEVLNNNIDIFNYDFEEADFVPTGLDRMDLVFYAGWFGDAFTAQMAGISLDVQEPEYQLVAREAESQQADFKIQPNETKTIVTTATALDVSTGLYQGRYIVSLPEHLTYVAESFTLNGKPIKDSALSMTPEANQFTLNCDEIGPNEAFTVSYQVQADEAFIFGGIHQKYEGLMVYNKINQTTVDLSYQSNVAFGSLDPVVEDEQFALYAENVAVDVSEIEALFSTKDGMRALAKVAGINKETNAKTPLATVEEDKAQIEAIKNATERYQQLAKWEDASDLIKPYPFTFSYEHDGKTLQKTITFFLTNETTKVDKENNRVIYGFDFKMSLQDAKKVMENEVIDIAHISVWAFDKKPEEQALPVEKIHLNLKDPIDLVNENQTGLNHVPKVGDYQLKITYDGVSHNHLVTATIYNPLLTLHLKQVILDEEAQLVIPTKGYFKVEHLNNLTERQVSAAYHGTGNSGSIEKEVAFTAFQYVKDQTATWIHIQPILPEYYEYVGFVSSTIEEAHDEKKLISTLPDIDFLNDQEHWVSIYLKPTTNAPKSYSWYYQTNLLWNGLP
ncbi:hypothetical protein [Isobaculum melis]|uniref:Uncharacterized protein n=1 Tax=Isobaculum melis TaxID=142588 RepID=A0A1H9T8Y2_9LACT|nr:hypothetical protein [Isobaculum melis]SER93527.1 hypothetical protein SAMN04488559_11157 [Isobaculum melis]